MSVQLALILKINFFDCLRCNPSFKKKLYRVKFNTLILYKFLYYYRCSLGSHAVSQLAHFIKNNQKACMIERLRQHWYALHIRIFVYPKLINYFLSGLLINEHASGSKRIRQYEMIDVGLEVHHFIYYWNNIAELKSYEIFSKLYVRNNYSLS